MSNNTYTVSIYATPMPLPLSFTVHCYVLTEHNGEKNRYGVLTPFTKETHPANYDGRIFLNIFPPLTGLSVIPRFKTHKRVWRFRSKEASSISGDENSPAGILYKKIANGELHNYPHKDEYHMVMGPNCNTFVQWVADLDESKTLHLPWNAWGKGYPT